MNITKFLNKVYFAPRLKEIEQYTSHAGELQQLVLQRLVRTAANTEWGKKHDYASIRTYEDFKKRLPIQTYEEVKPYVTRLRAGEQNLLWPSEIRWFAKSSGTTNDKSKFLPVSRESLHDTHYKGGRDAVAIYLGQNPESRFFSGKGLILGGSHAPNLNTNHSLVGDLSAILIENINPLVNLVRVPSKQTALMEHFEPKMEAIARETIHANVSNLSGVPSWMLVLIKHILEKTGKQSLEEIWPNLEVFFHGGVAFTPYREQYKDVIRSSKMHYVETYNASEGYFGTQNDPADPAMLLMIDWSAKEAELAGKRVDALWNGLTITEERKKNIAFSAPYMENHQIIVVKGDSPIKTKADLAGKLIGVQDGSSAVDAIGKDEATAKSFKDMKKYGDNVTALMDLSTGRVDAVVLDEVVGRYYTSKKPGEYVVLDDNFGTEEYGVGLRLEDKDLLARVDKAMADMKADGSAAKISEQWFGKNIVK